MKRRKAVSTLLIGIGGAFLAPSVFLSGCKSDTKRSEFLTDDDVAILDEVGETMLPATSSSPGAKAAKIGAFMKLYVTDCYSKKDQQVFINGIAKLNELSSQKYNDDFVELTTSQKQNVIQSLDKQAREYSKTKKKDEQDHYFSMMRNLTTFGYFSSEIGSTKARRYISVPGHYDGNVPYHKGDKAWAS
ncbi:MAG TPA: gluconate 2-dehydrogenase subunit 3 family protein [Flavitalea sp.]|nr:gluconate 2-dehydrogenase subunit 3 family protein [Flavitalea sp.]